MTWEDTGIAACACGVERRLYRPENGTTAMCLPCAMRHSGKRLPSDMEAGEPCASTKYNRARRERLLARGLCIDCGRLPHLRNVKRCMRCHTKMLNHGRKAS